MTLEMLWERADPSQVLRDRFGFTDAAAAEDWVVRTLERWWGVRVDACERIVMSDHNALAWISTAGGRMLLKWSIAPEGFERLAFAADLTAWLGERGLPVSAPVPTLDGRVQLEHDGVSMGLQHVIDGTLLDVRDVAQVHAAGATLARIHDALRDSPDRARAVGVRPPPTPLRQQIAGWLDGTPAHVPDRARVALRRLLAAAPSDELPVQIVHGDYRAANVLCADPDVVAVIDFEDLRLDHRIVELARSAVLLGTLFHDWGPVPAAVHRQLLDGYRSVSALTTDELAWWGVLVLWYTMLFVPPGDDPTGWGAAAGALAG
ncbi:phosphotransferase [Curtobacterium sp. VKM Ac-1393]|uniref:phosphotransferase n=1 Tax=Curtobacterium sp. VKM Ac-1393 TaxID=2783814 RepID=UPI00188AAAC4|nr:phosphotransferase [Curtobacterium sp. VKM Ac-1393]MBF4607470.1 phosphotransferase [Curtobacterium sp. VKM Ac-1393]